MATISAVLKKLRTTLLQCGLDAKQLHHIFELEDTLRPWRNQLQQRDNLQGQANAIISFLRKRKIKGGDNALVMFIRAYAEWEIDPEDGCYDELLGIARELEQALAPPPPKPKPAPPPALKTNPNPQPTTPQPVANQNKLPRGYYLWGIRYGREFMEMGGRLV